MERHARERLREQGPPFFRQNESAVLCHLLTSFCRSYRYEIYGESQYARVYPGRTHLRQRSADDFSPAFKRRRPARYDLWPHGRQFRVQGLPSARERHDAVIEPLLHVDPDDGFQADQP